VAHSFFIGFARLFMETAAGAIFLGEQEVTALPYVFIGIALVGVVVGLAVGKAEQLLSFKSFLSAILLGGRRRD